MAVQVGKDCWDQLTSMVKSQNDNRDNCQIQVDSFDPNTDDPDQQEQLAFWTGQRDMFAQLAKDYAAIVDPANDAVVGPGE